MRCSQNHISGSISSMGPIQSHNPDTIRQIESLVERFVKVDSSPVVEVVAVDSSPAVEGFLRLLVGSAERVVFGLGRLDEGGIGFFQQQGKK